MSCLINKKGSPQIDKAQAFCQLLHNQLPGANTSFQKLFDRFDSAIQGESKRDFRRSVTQGALNNVHGDWYEWLLGIAAWNLRITQGGKIAILLLPNVTQFDVVSLYTPALKTLIDDLRKKVAQARPSVRLVTSNPDFVMINTQGMRLHHDNKLNTRIRQVTPGTLNLVQGAYKAFENRCSFDNILGYMSVKSSFRPDRRLQLPHEGSLMKALYAHLQTRNWVIKPRGLKFYAMSMGLTKKDTEAMETIATHSITDVNVTPQRAVDDVFAVDTMMDARRAFSLIVARSGSLR